MTLSPNAQKLYDALPEDGSMLSGGKLRLAVVMSNTEFEEAKSELRASGVVAVGRGRGGTFGRSDLPSPQLSSPPLTDEGVKEFRESHEVQKKPTLQERAAIAREAKQAKTTEQRSLDMMREGIRERAHRELFPDIDIERIEVKVYGAWSRVTGLEPYLEVYNAPDGKGGAKIVRLPDPEAWLDDLGL